MSETEGHISDKLMALVAGRADLVSRIAAPLWARVGRPLESELFWVRPLLGEEGPEILARSLSAFDALDKDTGALKAHGVSRLLSFLLGESHTAFEAAKEPELVWTLPNSHPAYTVRGRSYLEACIRLIGTAAHTLTLVSPFIDPAGIGTLQSVLVGALSRSVRVWLFVHDALNLGTPTSRALEELRRNAERSKADLSVYSAEAGTGRDRLLNPLFHAKVVVADDRALLLGSANLTSHALGSNFEAGVLLGESAAKEALFILEGVLSSRTVHLVFGTKGLS
ncbi:MAG TPA: phospholipase D-like domain-containing protein [Bryobacteraceae bacterium]|jgi:phosphatidylserine/phosphatidylglycerophosphate/cardiolipin synthase-like enzyme|nr:phospholipase D-like domain-containing protein [Bryobacteraceae bacterium]